LSEEIDFCQLKIAHRSLLVFFNNLQEFHCLHTQGYLWLKLLTGKRMAVYKEVNFNNVASDLITNDL